MVRLKQAPLYRPVMPKTGKAFSVEESNFGQLGWVADKSGYRYQPAHPVTGAPWPDIPQALLDLWAEINPGPGPQCCLVNFYSAGAKMGLHQDLDEKDQSAAVIGVSLGDEALFRIGRWRGAAEPPASTWPPAMWWPLAGWHGWPITASIGSSPAVRGCCRQAAGSVSR